EPPPPALPRASRQLDIHPAPLGRLFEEPNPEETETVRPARKPRPRSKVKSTQKTALPGSRSKRMPHPTAPSSADAPMPNTDAAPRGHRAVAWLILLMVALGAAAMAVAYYWPVLVGLITGQ